MATRNRKSTKRKKWRLLLMKEIPFWWCAIAAIAFLHSHHLTFGAEATPIVACQTVEDDCHRCLDIANGNTSTPETSFLSVEVLERSVIVGALMFVSQQSNLVTFADAYASLLDQLFGAQNFVAFMDSGNRNRAVVTFIDGRCHAVFGAIDNELLNFDMVDWSVYRKNVTATTISRTCLVHDRVAQALYTTYYEDYQQALQACADQCTGDDDDGKQCPVLFAGHGLGGGAAVLAAAEWELEKSNFNRSDEATMLVTFGAPRALDYRCDDLLLANKADNSTSSTTSILRYVNAAFGEVEGAWFFDNIPMLSGGRSFASLAHYGVPIFLDGDAQNLATPADPNNDNTVRVHFFFPGFANFGGLEWNQPSQLSLYRQRLGNVLSRANNNNDVDDDNGCLTMGPFWEEQHFCSEEDLCTGNLTCLGQFSYNGFPMGQCLSRIENGASCQQNSDCASNRCDVQRRVCKELARSCDACYRNDDCESNQCRQFSFSLLPNQSPLLSVCAETESKTHYMGNGCYCNNNFDCVSGRCEEVETDDLLSLTPEFKCRAKSAPCERCDEDSDCESNNCFFIPGTDDNRGRCTTANGKLDPKCRLDSCSECEADADCQSGNCVDLGPLHPGICSLTEDGKMENGCFCDDNRRCQSGRCETDLFQLDNFCQSRSGPCRECNENSDCTSNKCMENGFCAHPATGKLPTGCPCDQDRLCDTKRCDWDDDAFLFLASDGFICQERFANGRECNENKDCRSNKCTGTDNDDSLNVIASIFTLLPGECTDGEIGSACTSARDCINDHKCVDNQCRSGTVGSPCNNNGDCQTGNCDILAGECIEKVDNGELCIEDSECQSDLCYAFVCTRPTQPGERCVPGIDTCRKDCRLTCRCPFCLCPQFQCT